MTDKDLAGTYSRRAKQGSKGKRACRQEAVQAERFSACTDTTVSIVSAVKWKKLASETSLSDFPGSPSL